jgi:hypothetical protein
LAGWLQAAALALIRGLVRRETERVGNCWVDLTRAVTRLLIPLAVAFGMVLAGLGVIENLSGPHLVAALAGGTQRIPVAWWRRGRPVRGLDGDHDGGAATSSADGAANASYDSFTALGGVMLLSAMMLGEISPGGVGSGLYGLLMVVLIAGFLGGLTEVIYAFTSSANSNGSAFGGLSGNTTFYNVALAVVMLAGRYLPVIFVLALAGSLARQKPVAVTIATLRTHGPVFAALTLGVALVLVFLTFLPALSLGPWPRACGEGVTIAPAADTTASATLSSLPGGARTGARLFTASSPGGRRLLTGSGVPVRACRAWFSRHDEAGFVGEHDGLGAVTEVQLGQDAADVGFGSLPGDEQGVADLGIGQAAGDQPEHLRLPVGQRAERGGERRVGAWPAGEVGDQPPGYRRGEQRVAGGHYADGVD